MNWLKIDWLEIGIKNKTRYLICPRWIHAPKIKSLDELMLIFLNYIDNVVYTTGK